MDDDGPLGVVRARDVDVISAGLTAVERLVLDDERRARPICNWPVFDVEPGGAALGGVVLEREIAVDAVPRSVEAKRDALSYVEGAVTVNGEQRREVANADGAALTAGATGERAGGESKDRKTAENRDSLSRT